MELASLFAKRKIAPILLLLPVAILLSFPACGDGMDTKVTATSPPEIGPTQPGTSNATSESEGQGTGTPSPPAITQRPSPTRASEFNLTSALAQQPMPTTFPPLPLHSPPPDIVPSDLSGARPGQRRYRVGAYMRASPGRSGFLLGSGLGGTVVGTGGQVHGYSGSQALLMRRVVPGRSPMLGGRARRRARKSRRGQEAVLVHRRRQVPPVRPERRPNGGMPVQ